MKLAKLPWWQTDTYDIDEQLPQAFVDNGGVKGVALVRAYKDGTTSKGWGLQGKKGEEGFMPRYLRNEFMPRRVLYGYNLGKWNFAFIMRSVRIIAIDIDGKNGGLEHATELGYLTPTLAETSKSGTGYHLFYQTEEPWTPDEGYGMYHDRIGIVQGVDIRGTGCVYHHPPQRWNSRDISILPKHLSQLLLMKQQQREQAKLNIGKIKQLDELEILLMHNELLEELAKPIPAGKRNNTLFAIGSQLAEAEVPDWEEKLRDRGSQIGLPDDEVDKIIYNIEAYR